MKALAVPKGTGKGKLVVKLKITTFYFEKGASKGKGEKGKRTLCCEDRQREREMKGKEIP